MDKRPSAASPFDRAVSAALRGAVAERQVTVAAIGKSAGIAPRTLARYMSGDSPIPVGKLVDITAAIGVEPGYILEAAKGIAEREKQQPRV